MIDAPHLSLVIPCYNEQENVPTLLERVGAALDKLGKPFEVILVDDGSTDSTWQIMTSLAAADARIKPIRRQPGHFFQCAGLLKQMRCAGNDHQLRFATYLVTRHFI